jgi:hypothetical protein
VIQPNGLLPSFEATSTGGQHITSVAFRQRRNLLVAFFDEPEREVLLGALTRERARLREANAEVLVFLAYAQPATPDLPLLTFVDPGRHFWQRFGIPESALVFTDQFGSIRKILWLPHAHPLPEAEEVLSWLEFIDLRCHECNIPLW